MACKFYVFWWPCRDAKFCVCTEVASPRMVVHYRAFVRLALWTLLIQEVMDIFLLEVYFFFFVGEELRISHKRQDFIKMVLLQRAFIFSFIRRKRV